MACPRRHGSNVNMLRDVGDMARPSIDQLVIYREGGGSGRLVMVSDDWSESGDAPRRPRPPWRQVSVIAKPQRAMCGAGVRRQCGGSQPSQRLWPYGDDNYTFHVGRCREPVEAVPLPTESHIFPVSWQTIYGRSVHENNKKTALRTAHTPATPTLLVAIRWWGHNA